MPGTQGWSNKDYPERLSEGHGDGGDGEEHSKSISPCFLWGLEYSAHYEPPSPLLTVCQISLLSPAQLQLTQVSSVRELAVHFTSVSEFYVVSGDARE